MNLPDDPDFQRGLATRTQVMGEDFVNKAFAGMTPFTEPMQHHITRRAWGAVCSTSRRAA
jgi:4-carboxymuconolactone decarboxylase